MSEFMICLDIHLEELERLQQDSSFAISDIIETCV